MIRLAVARLWVCTNSFNPRRTTLADVRRHEWTAGPAAFTQRSELDGVAGFLATRPEWEAVALCNAAAPPGGPLAAEVLGAWLAEVEPALGAGGFDGLYVSLHGACQAEGDPDGGLTVLRRLRLAARRLPIVASFTSLANMSDEVPLLLDGASGARGPDDGAAAAGRALGLLEGILAGRIRPVGAVARLPAVVVPEQLQRAIEDAWRDQAAWSKPPLLDASLFSGFPWADARWTGPSALVWADRDASLARETAALLALRLARGREPGPDPAPPLPAATLARTVAEGRTLVLDAADAPELGGLGDTPEVVRTVLACRSAASAVGVLADRRAVAAAHAAGVGADLLCPLGACFTSVYGPPVMAEVQVARLLEGMAVLRSGQVDLLVAERPTAAEPALFAAAGIDVGGLDLLALKGGETARSAFAPWFPVVLAAGGTGPTSHDLAGLPYLYVPSARRRATSLARGEAKEAERRQHAGQQWARSRQRL